MKSYPATVPADSMAGFFVPCGAIFSRRLFRGRSLRGRLFYSRLSQIAAAPKSLSWLKLPEAVRHKMRLFIAPSGHVLLPLWNDLPRIVGVSVWLCIGIHGSPFS